MTSINLDHLLSGNLFAFLVVFARVSCIMMLMPGIGESYVSTRVRMMLALAVSFLLTPPLLAAIPAIPATIAGLIAILGYEIFVGLFFGSLLRLIMSVLETVGTVVAMQTGLSNAVILNPAQGSQSPLPSAFLSVVGVTLIFVTGLDHYLLRSIVATYNVFPPGGSVLPGDIAQSFVQAFSHSFAVGIELSAPFIVIGLLMYMTIGIMQKLMPQVQLFLIMMPVQIWGGMVLLTITVSGIMALWLRYFDQAVGGFLGNP